VEQEGMCYFTHKEKERIFTNYYREILGKAASTQNLIDLEKVYPSRTDLFSLTQPFSEEEVLKALKLIPRDKSLGPDGFGSGIYLDFWDQVKPDIMNLSTNSLMNNFSWTETTGRKSFSSKRKKTHVLLMPIDLCLF
jgi:hypothetical protein